MLNRSSIYKRWGYSAYSSSLRFCSGTKIPSEATSVKTVWPLPQQEKSEDGLEIPRFYFPLRERHTIKGLELWKNIVHYSDQGPRKLSTSAKTTFYKEVKTAIETALLRLNRITMPVTSVVQLAQIAAQSGDLSVAEVVSSAFVKVGKRGLKMVIEGTENQDHLKVIPAVKVESVFLHPLFIQSVQGVQVLKEPYLLLCDGLVQDYDELVPYIDEAKNNNKALVLLVKMIDGKLVSRLVQERLSKKISVYPIELKRRHKVLSSLTLDDVSVITGGIIVPFPRKSNNDPELNALTQVGAVFSTIHELLLMNVNLDEEKLNNYIAALKKSSLAHLVRIKNRIDLLENCKLALLLTGGSNKNSRMQRMGIMEDALTRAQAAYNHGILPGAGKVLLEIKKAVGNKEGSSTKNILANTMTYMYAKTLEEPYRKDTEMYMEKTSKLPLFYSYDPARGEYVNLVDAGVLESSKEIIEGLMYALEKTTLYEMKVQVTKREPVFPGIFDVDVDSY